MYAWENEELIRGWFGLVRLLWRLIASGSPGDRKLPTKLEYSNKNGIYLGGGKNAQAAEDGARSCVTHRAFCELE